MPSVSRSVTPATTDSVTSGSVNLGCVRAWSGVGMGWSSWTGRFVCSPTNNASNPRSSNARPRSTGWMPSSMTPYQKPIFTCCP